MTATAGIAIALLVATPVAAVGSALWGGVGAETSNARARVESAGEAFADVPADDVRDKAETVVEARLQNLASIERRATATATAAVARADAIAARAVDGANAAASAPVSANAGGSASAGPASTSGSFAASATQPCDSLRVGGDLPLNAGWNGGPVSGSLASRSSVRIESGDGCRTGPASSNGQP